MELQEPATFTRPHPFCERLARALKASGLTTGQLSRLMDWPANQVRKYYLESAPPFPLDFETKAKIRKMAEYLGICYEWLAFGNISLYARKAKEAFIFAAKSSRLSAEERQKVLDNMEML